MDNLAHTLAGAALAQAGLRRRSGLATATLMIAANLPDVDVAGLAFGENLAWRRGWTHGPLGLALLPLLLVPTMVAFDRWQARRGTRPAGRLPVRPGALLALAYIGILSHPLMDWLNNYGIRCLMPFSGRWFYGDTLFIIDVWLWSALAIGVALSRQRWKRGTARPGAPALIAILVTCLYTTAMGLGSLAAERLATQTAEARGLPVSQAVASPVPIDPFRREVVVATGTAYAFGEVRWRPGMTIALDQQLTPTNMADPAVAAARAASEPIADFLVWSRLPFATIERGPGGTTIRIDDARYSRGAAAGRFAVSATLPPGR